MRIRMTGEFTYDLDEVGRQRTLPKGGVYDEPDAVAEAAVAAGRAVRLDPVSTAEGEPAVDEPATDPATGADGAVTDAAADPAAVTGPGADGSVADDASDPAAAAAPAARKPRA